mmetsp:Transcript_27117/g.94072  ORF Transcript_27117/g.94072 Transcript_27117/m.94072 type:complete len:249 (+) Transcript_27117:770-1516(+)
MSFRLATATRHRRTSRRPVLRRPFARVGTRGRHPRCNQRRNGVGLAPTPPRHRDALTAVGADHVAASVEHGAEVGKCHGGRARGARARRRVRLWHPTITTKRASNITELMQPRIDSGARMRLRLQQTRRRKRASRGVAAHGLVRLAAPTAADACRPCARAAGRRPTEVGARRRCPFLRHKTEDPPRRAAPRCACGSPQACGAPPPDVLLQTSDHGTSTRRPPAPEALSATCLPSSRLDMRPSFPVAPR